MTYKKKLIEVALPLPEINDASAYDKMPGIGPHPKGIHHWWARLPLPTARAVLFASVVDDPSTHLDRFPTLEAQTVERERLFEIIRQLMQKKMHEHPEIYEMARKEMLKYTNGNLPPVLDPFAGGGSIPLEAARLGFASYAADLNPVAVLLNKCNLELIPQFIEQPPINPEARKGMLDHSGWQGSSGLAKDVRYYGHLIHKQALKQIGHLYPKIKLSKEYGEHEANVIAWIWARTVASPNPAANYAHVPLVRSFWLNTQDKNNRVYIEPIVNKKNNKIEFIVKKGTPENGFDPGKGTVNRNGATCLLTGSHIPFEYIRSEGKEGRLLTRLLAIVVETPRGRTYVSPTKEQEDCAKIAVRNDVPDTDVPEKALGFRVQLYGINKHFKMFSPRQVNSMVVFSDLVKITYKDILKDAQEAGLSNIKSNEYAKTVTTFLALALDRCADYNCGLSIWKPSGQQQIHLFNRQAIPMVWDFTEANLMGEKAICWINAVNITSDAIISIGSTNYLVSQSRQIDAANSVDDNKDMLVSTDPPYYDNIGYAALSDFFYIWLRRTIGNLYPDLFQTILVPKESELTAAPERFGGSKEKAKEHFESGFRKSFNKLRGKLDSRFPLTVYYAFKQDDEKTEVEYDEKSPSNEINRTTGWETLLEALLGSGFQITATWPVRASQKWRMVARNTNALASYIVLACRLRSISAIKCSRRDYINELKKELPFALKYLKQGNIAPVDLAQAAIGPGMAVFSRFSEVVESSGNTMSVRMALSLINQVLDEVLAEQEGVFDSSTRWAIAWFEQNGMSDGIFGDAETLSIAKNTVVNNLVEGGIVTARAGKVRLVSRDEFSENWDPEKDTHRNVWSSLQRLIRALEQGGENSAAEVFGKLTGGLGETAHDLAYRLYKICDRKGWSKEALSYNGLIISWPEITRLSQRGTGEAKQTEMNI